MSDATTYPLSSLNTKSIRLSGSFAPNGSSALVATSTFGRGFTIARTSQGLFTITLAEKYVRLRCATISIQKVSAGIGFVQLGAVDVSSAKTIQIRIVDELGAVQDLAADANNRVHFDLDLSNDTVAL